MVKTMKRGLSLMFVLSLLVSMLAIPAKATNGSKSVTVGLGHNTEYVTVYTDKSFLGLKKTTITITNNSKSRTISLHKGYADEGELGPGKSKTISVKANGATYSFVVQSSWGSGNASVNFSIKNGY